MKNKYDNIYLFVSFIPLILLPISLFFSLLLAILVLVYGMHFQNQTTFKKSLNPLSVSLAFGVTIGVVQFFIFMLTLLGSIFTGIVFLNFVFSMTKILSVINFILLLLLIVFSIFAIMAVKNNKKMPLFHKLVAFFEKVKNDDDNEDDNEEIIIDPEN